jgi:hypothetical protein
VYVAQYDRGPYAGTVVIIPCRTIRSPLFMCIMLM